MTQQHHDWWGSAHIPDSPADHEAGATISTSAVVDHAQAKEREVPEAPNPLRPFATVPGQQHQQPVTHADTPPSKTQQFVHEPLRSPESQPLTGTLSTDLLRVRVRPTPASGWRRAVHRATLGAINPGESPADIEWRITNDRIRQTIRGDYKLAVLSLKGGSGKTTTTAGLGSVFAAVRPDRVIGIDANPDLGTLCSRIRSEHSYTVRDLLADENITRAADVRIYTNQAPSRFEILASPRDPRIAEAFSEDHYRRTVRILEEYYQLILTDCGTGIRHSSMTGVLDEADALALVTPPALDGAQSAEATLEWLEQNGHADLVARAVTVICINRPGKSSVDVRELEEHFSRRCRAVLTVPFDPHLAEGQEILLDRLAPSTIKALRSLAATIADDFPAAAQRRYGRAKR